MSAAPLSAGHTLLDSLEKFARGRGLDLLELYDEMGRNIELIVPAGHRVAECGNCHRKSIVPTGAMLRELREKYDLTQTEIARRAKLGKQHVSQVEAEARDPTAKLLAAYEEAAAERSREAQG